MSDERLPNVWLARHGETEWSLSGQHTSITDIPLTATGERNATAMAERIRGMKWSSVLSSPRIRARRTAELAGFAPTIDDDLREWDYGEYEGLKTVQIRAKRPDWSIFHDGAPGGESSDQVSARADRAIARLRSINGDVLIFTHGHFGRVLAARWIKLDVTAGALLLLSAGSLSRLGYDHDLTEPTIELWNDTCHLK